VLGVQMTWLNTVLEKGWQSIRLGASTCKAETAFCIEPGWLSAHEIPFAVPGSRHTEVPWIYTDARPLPPPEYPPHVVYVPQGLMSSRTAFTGLHARCLEKGLALKFVTAASTPNMQVVLVLVAGHQPLLPSSTFRGFSGDSASSQTQLTGTPAASEILQRAGHEGMCLGAMTSIASNIAAAAVPATSAPARKATGPAWRAQACFNGYFLQFKPGRDLQPAQPYNTWWKRRLSERRNRDRDALIWREDLRQMGPRQPNGLPQCEQAVRLQGYWDGQSSLCGAAANPRLLHCCQVQSVMLDHTFIYVTRPWCPKPGDPKGTLEPSRSDQLYGFLQECNCDEVECGKLRARQELKRLREEGVSYQLEVRHGSCLGNEHLGVFAGETIPAGKFLFEYVGVWLVNGEPEAREKVYEPAGLHYLYDLSHRYELLEKREGRRTGVGVGSRNGGGGGDNGGGGGGSGVCKKRRASRAVTADDFHAEVPIVVDATNLGNVARFVNHRCEGANLVSVNVCMGGLDECHMTIMIRTLRDIQPGEELTLDYQAGLEPDEKQEIRARPEGLVPCRCGAANCLGFVFPHIDRALGTWSGKARRNAAGARCPPAVTAMASPASTSTSTTTSSLSISDSDSGGGGALAVAAAAAAAATAETAVGSVEMTHGPVPSICTYKRSEQPDRVGAAKVLAEMGSSEQQSQHQLEDNDEDDDGDGYCCASAEAGNISLGGFGALQTLGDRPGSGSLGSESLGLGLDLDLDPGKEGGVMEGAAAPSFREVVSVVSPNAHGGCTDCTDCEDVVVVVSCAAAAVDAKRTNAP
ncbi:hypothetical protein Vretifemale_20628, partial [Volvox reticuliferus]